MSSDNKFKDSTGQPKNYDDTINNNIFSNDIKVVECDICCLCNYTYRSSRNDCLCNLRFLVFSCNIKCKKCCKK